MRADVMSRAELQSYLEGRGFAVYDRESTDDLRQAARSEMRMTEPLSYADIVEEFVAAGGERG